MSHQSMRGPSQEKEIFRLTKRVMNNIAFLDKNDIQVLEYMANKGVENDWGAYLGHSYESGEMKDVLEKIADHVPFVDEVEEFNKLMGKDYQNRKTPTIDLDDAQFVINFIQEELDELKYSVAKGDLVGILDALLDITYVGLGNGALVFGMKDKILPGYAEVQASNLSKICKTEEEAIATKKHVEEIKGHDCHYEKVGNGWVVYRTSDTKVMKSINYFAPNLKQFFDKK